VISEGSCDSMHINDASMKTQD